MSTAGVSVQEVVAEWFIGILQGAEAHCSHYTFESGVCVLTDQENGLYPLEVYFARNEIIVERHNPRVVRTIHYADPNLFEQLSEAVCHLLK